MFEDRFIKLAQQCEKHTNPEEIADRFDEALDLMLEYRGMTRADIRNEQPPIISFDSRFLTLLELEAWYDAAMMLAPCGRSGPGYFGRASSFCGMFSVTVYTKGYDNGKYRGSKCVIHHPVSSGGGPLVEGYGPLPGLAMLSAILLADGKWGKELVIDA